MITDHPEMCETCHDSGWERLECTGGAACGRRRPHLPHTFVRECPCRPMNPNYQERQAQTIRRVA